MTANEMNDRIGEQVYLEAVPGLLVRCLITNAKSSYGKTRLRLLPLEGKGEAWVNAERVVRAEEGRHSDSSPVSSPLPEGR